MQKRPRDNSSNPSSEVLYIKTRILVKKQKGPSASLERGEGEGPENIHR
jgi:hypothetical protein